jgi:hypothetical protein
MGAEAKRRIRAPERPRNAVLERIHPFLEIDSRPDNQSQVAEDLYSFDEVS